MGGGRQRLGLRSTVEAQAEEEAAGPTAVRAFTSGVRETTSPTHSSLWTCQRKPGAGLETREGERGLDGPPNFRKSPG